MNKAACLYKNAGVFGIDGNRDDTCYDAAAQGKGSELEQAERSQTDQQTDHENIDPAQYD